MTFRVMATPAACRQLAALPTQMQARFRAAFELLEGNPFRSRPGLDVAKMEGDETYRLHIGRFRGIFRVDGPDIVFLRFGHRSIVYR